MSLLKKYNLLDSVHSRIKLNATGTPDEFAESIGKSKRCMYNILDELKELGAEIHYSKHKQSFEYLNNFEIDLKINCEKIKGGKKYFNIFLYNAQNMHSNDLLLHMNNKL